jgi:hypothetical protein
MPLVNDIPTIPSKIEWECSTAIRSAKVAGTLVLKPSRTINKLVAPHATVSGEESGMFAMHFISYPTYDSYEMPVSSEFTTPFNVNEIVIGDVKYRASVEGYPLPNDKVVNCLDKILRLFTEKGIMINDIDPLSEGGVGIEIKNNRGYFNIVIDNELDATYYTELIGDAPRGWDLTFNQLLNRLQSEF